MTKHGRLIDADAFGNRMYHEVFEKDSEDQKWDSGCWMRYKLFERVLRDAPTIEPERETGEWIAIVAELGDHKIIVEGYNCSKCGRYDAEKDNFCPDCGARMEGK